MTKRLVLTITLFLGLASLAMPTRKELERARELVAEVTAADVEALKKKTKTPLEVATTHIKLAGESTSEAEKYLLLQGAFHLYVKGKDYDNAAKAIETMQTEIKDFNPEVIVELCDKVLVRNMQEDAPKLYAIKENARRIVLYRKALVDDSFKGLARTRTEQKVKESDALASFVVASGCNERIGSRPIDLSKPLVLDLGQGQKLSFLPCPAGSFEMGGRMNGYPDSDGKHKVIITRPFYYLPSFVQSNQWAAVMGKKIEKTDSLFVATRQEHEEYLQKLTERFCGKIPKGYVFRFLTEAEYLYAVNKGKMISSKWSGFFLDLFGADQNGKWQRDVHCWKGSYGLEGAEEQHVRHLTYEDVETDPLAYYRDYLYPKTLVFDFQYRQKKSKSLSFPMFARIAIGPDLVAEKKAIQEKTGIWPISTPAENDGPVKTIGEEPPTITKGSALPNRTFDIGCERKLEMIACPAGTFTMGEKTVAGDCNEVRKHQVKITRPFWLSKVSVTRSQWRKLMYGSVEGEKENPQYEFAAVNSALSRKRAFMGALNNRFKAELPEGYVFRLPTEAELAYAMTSGGRDKVTDASIGTLGPSKQDKEKIIRELTAKGVKLGKAGKDMATKVGMAKPNTWGFYDIINNGDPFVLDRISPCSKMRKLKIANNGNLLNISYDDVEVDPLCWDDGEEDLKSLYCSQGKIWGRKVLGDWGWNETFRVCLGPDLVAEKKAKK